MALVEPGIGRAFIDSMPGRRNSFASVGRFALRGVGKPQELFTLDLFESPVVG